MELKERILILLNLVSVITSHYEIKEESFVKNDEVCKEFGKKYFFKTSMVLGKPWRVYYTWYADYETKCLDMKFKNSTRMIQVLNRFVKSMFEHMHEHPAWMSPALYVTMGKGYQEMMLFKDNGPPGRFTGVVNARRYVLSPELTQKAQLLKFQLKLVRGGKFLVMLDCKLGMASLSARASDNPQQDEVAAVAAEMDFGEPGLHACIYGHDVE